MNKRFINKVVLVTGGASGIGRACCLDFADEGATVVIADVNEEGGNETVSMLKAKGNESLFIKTDVSVSSDVENLINQIVERYSRLDCACNNAGVEGINTPTAQYSETDWDQIINTNLKGVWLSMKYEIPQMLKQETGSIVNISSGLAFVAFPGMPAYVSSKHGVVGLTKTAALEYSRMGIKINAVCPGPIRTLMMERAFEAHPEVENYLVSQIPQGRLGKPEEVAKAVLWLASDDSPFVAGHTLVVDGGYVAR